jgi:transcriptional regulator with XRE-family HTH domain
MTPAAFDTRRRLLGLSIQEAAVYLGTTRRTVERWISGYSEISEDAVAKLGALEDKMWDAVRDAEIDAEWKRPRSVELKRYRNQEAVDAAARWAGLPLGAHAIMIGWIAEALEAKRIEVEIVWG